jgi:hypothetical protein
MEEKDTSHLQSDVVRRRVSRARVGIVILMVATMAIAAVTRDWAMRNRAKTSAMKGAASGASRTSLGSMNSYALALLLGGLRGPLVMWLWSTSESQKADKDLEDFDTKVEWIRLLQPEFDTVHIFQIWNKAYNISVQMASLHNKYITILDAIEYGQSILRTNPNNININVSIAQVYSDKLGGSAEKDYYRQHVRHETLPHPRKQRLNRDDPAWRPLDMDPVLDAKGYILPQLLQPVPSAAIGSPSSPGGYIDGSQLQFLAKYQPYPYGLSPYALAFNYFEKALILQRVAKQKHANLSAMVVDSRPALTLKQWAEAEMGRGRRNELMAYQLPVPDDLDKVKMEMPTAQLPSSPAPDQAHIDAALNAYALAPRLADDSIAQYEEHLKRYPNGVMTYESHIDGLVGLREMMLADNEFLTAKLKPGADAKTLLESAAKHYRAAMEQNYRILLRYYTSEDQAARLFPNGLTRNDAKKIPADQLAGIYAKVMEEVSRQEFDPDADDRTEFKAYVDRAEKRLAQINP